MERKIGETFEYKGKIYKVAEMPEYFCAFCDLEKECYSKRSYLEKVTGTCSPYNRKDTRSVCFKEIKDNNFITISSIFSDNNSLKNINIECPTGFSIDTENSDLKAGIIKFKKKELTYKDILDSVGKYPTSSFVTPCNSLKLNAIDMLMNIARYYNGDWKPEWKSNTLKYFITFSFVSNSYSIIDRCHVSISTVFFKNKEDAQAVIDNPNFREILDAIFKN